ncbi:MAG: hypothetical protein R2831_00905 [Chitinophagaceae bacterium]
MHFINNTLFLSHILWVLLSVFIFISILAYIKNSKKLYQSTLIISMVILFVACIHLFNNDFITTQWQGNLFGQINNESHKLENPSILNKLLNFIFELIKKKTE